MGPVHAVRGRGTVRPMQTRRLGRTGHRSSVAILGGAAFWDTPPAVTGAATNAALAAGVNHLDVAPQYGRAEEPSDPWCRRSAIGCSWPARRCAPMATEPARNLSVHSAGSPPTPSISTNSTPSPAWKTRPAGRRGGGRPPRPGRGAVPVGRRHRPRALGAGSPPGGSAAVRPRHGHVPDDPRLWADTDYRRDAELLLEECAHRDVGVMAIKAVAARPWAGRRRGSDATWYEPYRAEGIERGVRFTLSVPGVCAFCTPGDLDLLPAVLAAAESFEPMGAGARDAACAEVSGEAHISRCLPDRHSTRGSASPVPGRRLGELPPLHFAHHRQDVGDVQGVDRHHPLVVERGGRSGRPSGPVAGTPRPPLDPGARRWNRRRNRNGPFAGSASGRRRR